MFGTKNREAWSLFLSKAGCWDHLQAQRLTPTLRGGADLESSVTGAEGAGLFSSRPSGTVRLACLKRAKQKLWPAIFFGRKRSDSFAAHGKSPQQQEPRACRGGSRI